MSHADACNKHVNQDMTPVIVNFIVQTHGYWNGHIFDEENEERDVGFIRSEMWICLFFLIFQYVQTAVLFLSFQCCVSSHP